MRLRTFHQLIKAIEGLADPESIFVFGFSSLLALHPELGEVGQPLESSYDADILVRPLTPGTAAMLMDSVGRESLFAKESGYYADILHPSFPEGLPDGWESRLVPIPGFSKAFALNPYDLALVKVILARPKDMELLRALLKLGLLDLEKLRAHYHAVPLQEKEAFTASRNLHLLAQTNSA